MRSRMRTRVQSWLESARSWWAQLGRRRQAAVAGAGLLVLMAGVAAVITLAVTGGGSRCDEPVCVEVIGPIGERVNPMTPVQVRVAGGIDRDLAVRALQISNEPQGLKRFEGDLLTFRPQWPGFARGVKYDVALALPASVLPPGQEATTVSFSFTTDGKLHIASVFPPDGAQEMALDASIMLQFSRSVAPLTVVTRRGPEGIIEFDPPAPGQGRWLNTSLYTFTPAGTGWAPATRYTATVKAGLANDLGAQLEGDYIFSFTTLSPAVASVAPPDNSMFVAPLPDVTVQFNQPVDRASAEAGFALAPKGAADAVTGSFQWPDDRTFVFRPAQPLPLQIAFEAVVKAGVKSLGAAAAMATERRWTFTTVGVPRVVSTEPADGDQHASSGAVRITFSNPMDQPSVESAITIVPKPADTPYFYWDPGQLVLSMSASMTPSTAYRVILTTDAKDRYGQPLAQGLDLSFVTDRVQPGFRIFRTSRSGTFNAYLDPRVMLSSWNLDTLDLQLYSVDRADLITAESGLKPYPYQPPASGLLRTWSESIPDPPLNLPVTTASRLAADGATLPEGVYFLRVTAPQSVQRFDDMFFVVSSANVVTKWTQRDLLLWIVDMNTGAPLAGLPIQVLGISANAVAAVTTDQDGLARVDVPRSTDNDLYRGYYVWAQADGRTVLAGTSWNDGIAPWNFQFGINFQFAPPELAGYVYTDRPIYRPGETVYFKGVVRSDDDASYSVASVADLTLLVRDDQGRLVDSRPVTLSEMGTLHSDLSLSPEAATGMYSVQLAIGAVQTDKSTPPGKDAPFGIGIDYGPNLPTIAFVSFRVAEFRKPEFEVSVATDKNAYVNGEDITSTVSADLFFGAPLANAGVQWKVTSQPYLFRPDAYPGYSFSDYNPEFNFARGPFFQSQEFLRGQGAGTTDAQGRFTFAIPADISRDPLSQTFTLEATVTDQNAQSVAAFTAVPVHKGGFYVGLKPQDYVAFAGSPSDVNLVSVDPDGKPVPDVPVQVSVYLRQWRTVRERDADGEQRYRSEAEDTLVQTIGAATGADGAGSFSFTPAQSGAYYLVAQAQDAAGNVVKSAAFVWASSAGFASWYIGNDDLIQLVADKAQYRPGDTAKILVAAPFENSRGLITQERGRLRAYELRDFPTNSEILEVPITSDHIPNIFIGVTLFKPPTPDNPMPQAKFGLLELKVSTEQKELHISIEPDRQKLQPRDTVTYQIDTTDSEGRGIPAELSLALVDLSVLSLQDEFARRPVEAFWSAHPLGVATGSSFAASMDRTNELAISRQNSPASGGKGGGGGPGEQTRTFFPNTAYWQPALQTDSSGRATVAVPLPDTLTTWRLTTRGVTSDTRVGDARNDIVTSRDVIVRPAVPRFLVAGDQASLGAIVHNFTGASLDMTVSLQADGLEIKDAGTRAVSVASGQDALVRWDTSAPIGRDSVTLTFQASGGGASDSVQLKLPVYGFWTPETAATAGQVTDKASEAIEVPYYVRPDAGELTVRVAPSLASGVNTALAYLIEYPWESAEVTVSRFLPRLALKRAVSELGLTDLPGADVDALVGRSLQRLYNNQHADGGWGWWSGDDSDAAISAYVLIGLADAKRAGFGVDQNVEERAATYLAGELDKSRDVQTPQFDLRAYVLYALARDGRGDLGRGFSLAEQRASLGNTAKAWVALAVKLSGGDGSDPRLTALLTDLQSSAIPSATGNHWEEKVYDPNVFSNSVQTTAQVLQAFTELQPDHALVDGTLRWLMVARKEGHWESPHDTAIALLAITDFMIVRKDVQESFDYRVDLDGNTRLEGSAERGKVNQEDVTIIEMKDLLKDVVNRLDIIRSPAGAAGRLYYTAHLRYFTPAEDIEAATYGIGVSHEYFRGDGDTPVTDVRLGDTVRVKLTLVAPSDLNFLVLEDYLPAGLEPIDTSLKTTPQEFRRLLYEEQRKAYQVAKRYSPFGHTDIRDNRVALFARFVPRGVYEYTYFAQATTPGRFKVPPATAYEQYFPEVWGRSDSGAFVVQGEEAGASELSGIAAARQVPPPEPGTGGWAITPPEAPTGIRQDGSPLAVNAREWLTETAAMPCRIGCPAATPPDAPPPFLVPHGRFRYTEARPCDSPRFLLLPSSRSLLWPAAAVMTAAASPSPPSAPPGGRPPPA